MYFNPFNLALVLCSFATLIDTVFPSADSPNYPGVIELVGYNDRRARTRYMPPDDQQYHSKSKMAADIETVKQNIEKYNKLLKMDTKNLPDSQKEILERIVERVARLKESIDISQDQDNATASSRSSAEYVDRPSASSAAIDESQETTLSDSLATSSESAAAYSSSSTSIEETTKNQDSTTTSDDASQTISTDAIEGDIDDTMVTNQDINASEEIATAKEMDATSVTDDDESNAHDEILSTELSDDDDEDGEIPTSTTIGSGEMDADQFVAARSNNNNRRTLVSTSKTKSRPNSTKRPTSSLTKLSTSSMKRVNGQKPSSMVGSSMKPTSTSSVSASSPSTATSSITTVQPMVKIQKPSPPSSIQQQPKEPSSETTMMKVQHQLPQKQQQQQQQLNKVQTYQAQLKPPQEEQKTNEAAVLAGATSAAASSSMASLQQIEQKTLSTPPSLQQQQQQQQAAAIQIQQRTPIGGTIGSSSGSSITNTAGSGSLGSDMLYDSNVNTSSIIDSLNNAREEFYNKAGISSVKDKKTSATAKPTKYHYYPHNQHIYLLPECAIQQVCNAVYVRLNYTQPLCACPSRYRDPCSASLNEDDQHTTKLVGDGKKKAITLAKTCETINEMRECRTPKDWSLLALQNTRTGKSHYLVICRCPDHYKMEGPMAHDQPTYASVPGIRVFGMMCVKPGYQVRKPSVQPPKRYQLQKPYYIPNSQNKYSSIKDHSRPSYGGGLSSSYGGSSSSSLNYQPPPQHHTLHQQDSYQYLNRPESSSTLFVSSSNNHNSHNDYPESISFNGGIYGRNNERNADKPIPAAEEDMASTSSSSPNESETPLSSSSSSPISSEAKSEEVSRTSSAEIDESPTTLEAVDDATSSRNKRSVDDFESEIFNDEDLESAPEFPWQKAIAFQQSIVWD